MPLGLAGSHVFVQELQRRWVEPPVEQRGEAVGVAAARLPQLLLARLQVQQHPARALVIGELDRVARHVVQHGGQRSQHLWLRLRCE